MALLHLKAHPRQNFSFFYHEFHVPSSRGFGSSRGDLLWEVCGRDDLLCQGDLVVLEEDDLELLAHVLVRVHDRGHAIEQLDDVLGGVVAGGGFATWKSKWKRNLISGCLCGILGLNTILVVEFWAYIHFYVLIWTLIFHSKQNIKQKPQKNPGGRPLCHGISHPIIQSRFYWIKNEWMNEWMNKDID